MSRVKTVVQKKDSLRNSELTRRFLEIENQTENSELACNGRVYRIRLPPYEIIILDNSDE